MGKCVSIDTKDFSERLKQYGEKLKTEQGKAIRGAATAFANVASVKTPPSMGKEQIAEEYYHRPVYWVPKVIQEKKAGIFVNEDIAKVRKKYFFKVIVKSGSRKQHLYFKRKDKAERAAIIKNRGLLRASWGMSLPQLGSRKPKMIAALLQKSTHLKKLTNLNIVRLKETKEQISITIINVPAEGNSINARAAKAGEEAAQKYIKEQLERISKSKVKI